MTQFNRLVEVDYDKQQLQSQYSLLKKQYSIFNIFSSSDSTSAVKSSLLLLVMHLFTKKGICLFGFDCR